MGRALRRSEHARAAGAGGSGSSSRGRGRGGGAMLLASAVVVWEWLNEHGRWRPYSPAVSHHIEAVARAGPRAGGSVVLGQADSRLAPYIIDLQSMHQFRQDTGESAPPPPPSPPRPGPAALGGSRCPRSGAAPRPGPEPAARRQLARCPPPHLIPAPRPARSCPRIPGSPLGVVLPAVLAAAAPWALLHPPHGLSLCFQESPAPAQPSQGSLCASSEPPST